MDYVVNPESIAAVVPFTIQVGGRYNRADGKVSGELCQGDKHPYTLYDSNSGWHYYLSGWAIVGQASLRLISEYIEPTADELITNGDFSVAKIDKGGSTSSTFAWDKAEPQDEWGPWIGWNGGECPVDDHVMVQYQVKSETRFTAEKDSTERAGDCGWDWHDSDNDYGDIIAYRIKKKLEAREYEVSYQSSSDAFYGKHYNDKETRNAIITTQGDNISIRWADE